MADASDEIADYQEDEYEGKWILAQCLSEYTQLFDSLLFY